MNSPSRACSACMAEKSDLAFLSLFSKRAWYVDASATSDPSKTMESNAFLLLRTTCSPRPPSTMACDSCSRDISLARKARVKEK